MPAKNTTAQTKTTPRKNPNTLPSTRSSALIRATSSILRKIVPKSPMAKTQATQIKTAAIIVRMAGPKLSSGMSTANSGENRIAKTIPITQPTIDKISRTTPRVTPTTVERTNTIMIAQSNSFTINSPYHLCPLSRSFCAITSSRVDFNKSAKGSSLALFLGETF